MSIDLGNNPVGSPPTEEQRIQIKKSLEVDSPGVYVYGDFIDRGFIGHYIPTYVSGRQREVWVKNGEDFSSGTRYAFVRSDSSDPENDPSIWSFDKFINGVGQETGWFTTDSTEEESPRDFVGINFSFYGVETEQPVVSNSFDGDFLIKMLPDTLEVDYVQTADQSGFTIPANSFGHKGGVPYFGDSPIAPPAPKFLQKSLLAAAGPYRWTQSLGVFPFAAGELLDTNARYFLEVDLVATFTSGSGAPPAGSGAVALSIVHQAEFDAIIADLGGVGDILIDLGPLATGHDEILIRGTWLLQPTGMFSGSNAYFLKSSRNINTGATATRPLMLFSEYVCSYGSGPSAAGVAENMHIIVHPTAPAGLFYDCLFIGKVNFYKVQGNFGT